MSNSSRRISDRVLAVILSVLLMVGMLPTSVFAVEPSTVTTDLSAKNVFVGEYTEFTVHTTPNDDLDTMVFGYFDFNGGDWSAIESLQYKESQDGQWYDLPQGAPFGPPSTGFPMSDATSTFRVKFSTAGTYSFSVSMKAVDGGAELCALNETVTASVKPSVITTDIADQNFVVGTSTEFSFTSIPNGHAGEMVFGKFTFSDWDAVEKLEYWGVTENQWLTLPRDVLFGPAGTGFPMTQATTRLQVTFNKAGTYTCTVALVKASDTNVALSSIEKEITVTETIPPVVDTITGNPSAWALSATVSGTVSDNTNGSGVSKVVFGTTDAFDDAADAGVTFDAVGGTYSFSAAANGTYYVWAIDASGNHSEAKSIEITKIDNTDPTISATADPENWTNSTIKVEIEAGDAQSNVTVKYSDVAVGDAGATDATQEGDKWTFNIDKDIDGTYTYYVWALDEVGHQKSAEVTVYYDGTAPIVAITPLASTDWTNQDVTITGTVNGVTESTTVSGLDRVVYGADNNPQNATGVATVEGLNYSFTVTTNGVFNVWSLDKAGNYSDVATITINHIDKVKPTISVDEDEYAWSKDSIIVSGAATDADSGIDSVWYNTSNSLTGATQATELSGGDYSFVVFNTSDVNATYYIWAKDTAGNYSDPVATKVKIDITNPTITAEKETTGSGKNRKTVVSGVVTDSGSGVKRVVYATVNDITQATSNGVTLDSDGSYKFTVPRNQNFNGTFFIWVEDNAGNIKGITSEGITVDMVPPTVDSIVVTPNVNDSGIWTNGSVTISGTASDTSDDTYNTSVKEVKFATEDDISKATSNGVTLNDDGSFSFTVDKEFNGYYYIWAIDEYGNESVSSKILVKIDTTKPTASIAIDEKTWDKLIEFLTFGLYKNTDLEVTITAADNESEIANSGVAKIEYYKVTGEAANDLLDEAALAALDASAWTEYSPFAVSTDEVFVVYAKVTDRAGNVDYFCSEKAVRDTVAPQAKIEFDANNTWNTLLTSLTFGLYRSEKVDVSIEATDELSGVKTVDYYVVDGVDATTPLTKDDLRALSDSAWISYAPFSIPTDKMVVVYARVADNAGNIAYFCSDGLIVEESAASIELNLSDPAADNGDPDVYGYYNDDVTVDISVVDDQPYSGIKTIEYWVTKDKDKKVQTQGDILYSFGYDGSYDSTKTWEITGSDIAAENGTYTGIPTQAILKKSWAGQIVVSAKDNNSCDVVVTVKVTDNAGNVSTKEIKLDIDYKKATAPVVKVDYKNEGIKHNDRYFDGNRTATITITEREHHFVEPAVYINEDVPEGATNYIYITAVDANRQPVKDENGAPAFAPIIKWVPVKDEKNPDNTIYVAEIPYDVDANYTFEMKVMDKAENANNGIDTDVEDAPYEFTVDKLEPSGTVTLTTTASSETWNKILEALTFGLYDATHIDVTATANDDTSPVKVEYYKATGAAAATALTDVELKEHANWTLLVDNGKCVVDTTDVLTVKDYEQFVMYLKLTDYAGNTRYIRSGGAILDNKDPVIEQVAPQITVTPSQQPVNGIYNTDVLIDVAVEEIAVEDVYSGLRSVTYEIFNHSVSKTEPTQTGVLLNFTNKTPAQSELIPNYEKLGAIKVDKTKNNSNEVEIKVVAVDNAGNRSEKSIFVKIDITAPTIAISYNNNNPDSGSYYNADRTATIKITERNFKAEDVKITITNTDGTIPTIPGSINDWTEVVGTGNLDNTTYTATIRYSADGDYKFDIAYTDLADNKCTGANYAANTQNPTEFTIDQTNPTIQVSYNNNDAANEKYFNAVRTATVTIVEHNFNVDRVTFTRHTARGGQLPNITWTNNGDTHVATISYTADGDYTFDVTMTDMAGNASGAANYGNSAAGKDFVIDTTFEDMISISGVENGVAYGHDADVIPNIKISDINLNGYTVALVGVQKDKTIDLTEEVNKLLDAGSETVSGIFDIFETKQDLDGIYTLSLTSEDKAGNKDSEEIVFTVNRFGSVYVYNQYLLDLIADGGSYVLSVDEDLVIDEYNADRLLADSLKIEITVDGRPLENVKYTVTPEINDTVAVGESGWFQYKYTISRDNFADDGVYKISISSKDATGNKPENNNYEGMEMSFWVDSTKPEIPSIVGLEESIINAQEVTVKYTVFDTIGLKSIKVYVNGELVDEITDFSADMNNFSGQFTLLEQSNAQSVKIIVEDMSGNITDTSAKDFTSAYAFNDSVTVSTNVFVRWYANKPLFWGSIVGVVAVAGGLGAFIAAKRKKKEKAEAK